MQAAEGFTWSQEQGQGPVSEGQGQGQPGVGEFELAPFGFDSEGLPESVRNSRRHGAVTADAGFLMKSNPSPEHKRPSEQWV